jgi:LCP family protein required for cell wall assembly
MARANTMPAGMIDLKPPGRRFTGTAALLSAVLPGAGQWWLRRRWRGALLALPALAVAAGLGVLARRGAAGLAELLVQPRWLWALVAVNAAFFLLRLAALADAWWLERPAGQGWRWSLLSLAPALVLAVALTLPQVIVHRYSLDALGLLHAVFEEPQHVPSLEERIAALLAQGLSREDLGPVLSTTTSTTTTAPPTATAGTSTTTSTTTTLPPEEVLAGALGDNLVTVLLAGGDFGPGRKDLRTDVMILAAFDLDTGKAALIGVSRDLVQAPLPPAWAQADTMIGVQAWHEDQAYQARVERAIEAGEEPPERQPSTYCNCYFDRINYLHVHTASWVVTFPEAPDPGMEALRQTLEVTLGVPIDYYVLVDFAGFVDLVDAVGGVEVNSTEYMDIKLSPAKPGEAPIEIDIAPGRYHMDGRTALAYVRNRTGSSDGRRMLRQRCMLRDLASEMDAVTLLTRFTPISRAIATSTTSTIPLYLLPDVIRVVAGLEPGDIATAAIGYPGHTRGANYLGLPIIDAGKAQAAVAEVLAALAVEDGGGAATFEDECG